MGKEKENNVGQELEEYLNNDPYLFNDPTINNRDRVRIYILLSKLTPKSES